MRAAASPPSLPGIHKRACCPPCRPAFAAAEGAELVEYAVDMPLEDVLAEGLRRLNSQDTWKVWQFNGQEFYDAESFRSHITSQHVRPELLHLLPKDDSKVPERPAEAALRQRMTDLLQQVQTSGRQAQEDQGAGVGTGEQRSSRGRRSQKTSQEQASSLMREANVEVISQMLEALEKEHDHLYQSLLRPITTFVCDLLPVRSGASLAATRQLRLGSQDMPGSTATWHIWEAGHQLRAGRASFVLGACWGSLVVRCLGHEIH